MQNTDFPQRVNITGNNPSIGPKISALRAETMKQNMQLLNEQVQKMKQFNQKIGVILKQIGQNKITCQQTINNLNSQISQLDTKVAQYQRNMSVNTADQQYRDKIKLLNQQYVNTCKQRIRLANQLNIKHLSKVHIEDKKSPANELFKWIIVSIYNEPETKYFWPNFKQEALQNDKGKDFIQRLGKIPASKEQHKVKTQNFLTHYNQIVAAPQLKNHQADADKIRQIAEFFKKGYIVAGQVKQNEHLIEKSKQSTMERDQQFVRWKARSQALKDRIHINQSYLRMLNETQQKLIPKAQNYPQKIQSGETLRSQFESFDKWTPSINHVNGILKQQNHETHHSKGNCQCSLF